MRLAGFIKSSGLLAVDEELLGENLFPFLYLYFYALFFDFFGGWRFVNGDRCVRIFGDYGLGRHIGLDHLVRGSVGIALFHG